MPRVDKLKMSGINHIIIDGRLTRDPELKSIPSGMSVCELGIAHEERKKNKTSGEWESDTMFWDVSVWGKAAENLAAKASKGDPVLVEGRLSMSRWSNADGEQSRVKIQANMVRALTWPEPAEDIMMQAKSTRVAAVETSKDDIPF